MFVLIMILLIVIICLIYYYPYIGLVKVRSDIDGHAYYVRNIQEAKTDANTLAILKRNILTLSNDLEHNKEKYKDFSTYIDKLYNGLKNSEFMETPENSSYTSYTINKGEKLIFCLRSKENGKIHDVNLLMYVVLHEMAHVACPVYGHGPLFKKIFAFLVARAIEMGLYKKIDFRNNPQEYCGITITNSII